MEWVLIVVFVGGGVDFVGPFSTRGQCEQARRQIMYVDREVRQADCVPRRDER